MRAVERGSNEKGRGGAVGGQVMRGGEWRVM
jgi:hypothetical protein